MTEGYGKFVALAKRDRSCLLASTSRLALSGDCKRNTVARMDELRFCFTGLSNMHRCCTFLFALAGLLLLDYRNVSTSYLLFIPFPFLSFQFCLKLYNSATFI